MKRRLDPAGIRRGECWNRRSDASGVGFESSGAGSESASFPLPSEMIELGPRGRRGWRAGSDSGDFCSYRLQIEGTVRTRGNESVPSLCSLAAAAIPGVHSEDLIRTPTSSIAGRGVVRKGSK
ncbi:uncharacterized protein LOC120698939 isoform X2 [Panicum virgatum]|uniref:uncharacterized protein LOC120698939 isoform X2 n=1 Tax=Panicum virgatum TaxID=38727 RepID=UPI0019D5BDF6|nr:uncharacterized protein LOC120698939 isoform X2 [Panicum virgatum]